jgi:cytochrome c oxidase cbb3-type subunit 3
MNGRQALVRALLALVLTAPLPGCEREERAFRETPVGATPMTVPVTELRAGPTPMPGNLAAPYDENAWAVSEGKRLYSQFNCVGCHAHGGGGMGPALMDEAWIYGSAPAQIYQTIVEGRPNGMPSFRGRLTSQQVWQLVSYVRSLSALVRMDVRPGRDDHMQGREQEQTLEKRRPRQSGGGR